MRYTLTKKRDKFPIFKRILGILIIFSIVLFFSWDKHISIVYNILYVLGYIAIILGCILTLILIAWTLD